MTPPSEPRRDGIAMIPDAPPGPTFRRGRAAARWLLAAAYLFVGIAHLRSPGGFLPIVPGWVPWPRQTILLTGLCEIAGAIGLTTRRWRRLAGIMLAAYAVCVYPANLKHAFDHVAIGGTRLGWWYHGPRLALQPVIVWWALFVGEVIVWPFRRAARRGNQAR